MYKACYNKGQYNCCDKHDSSSDLCKGSICTDGDMGNLFKYTICKNTWDCGTTNFEIEKDSSLDFMIELNVEEVCWYRFNVTSGQVLRFKNHGD